MLLLRTFALLFFVSLSSSMYASSVTGTASLDPQTQVYTYSYTLTNSQTNNYGVIDQFYVGVNSIGWTPVPFISSTSPAGWQFTTGWCCAADGASEVQWYFPTPAYTQYFGLPEGQSLSGFSFQTKVAPGNWVGSNVDWFYPSVQVEERTDQVIAPDYLIPNPPPFRIEDIPEPGTIWMLLAGFGVIGAYWSVRTLASTAALGLPEVSPSTGFPQAEYSSNPVELARYRGPGSALVPSTCERWKQSHWQE